MVCTRCAGTESGLGIRGEAIGRVRLQKNHKNGAGCARCEGAGLVPTIQAACSHCGGSLLSWQPCPDCIESKAYKTANVKPAKARGLSIY